MSDFQCPKCGLPATRSGHICIFEVPKREPPKLEIVDGSEICADVFPDNKSEDGVMRPVLVEQDDGHCLTLTREDATRLLYFLSEAIPFLEGKIVRQQ